MTLVLSIIFIIIILAYYNILGNAIILSDQYKNKFALTTVIGWLFTFFIGWIIGVPCQLFCRSWDEFAIIYGIALILIGVLASYRLLHKKFRNLKFSQIKDEYLQRKIIKNIICQHLAKYWFIYLITTVFCLFSIANMQSYILNNYNDDYYIVKMIHMVHSSPILSENYFLGTKISIHSFHDVLSSQSYRVFNTYELVYSFFGTIMGIPLVYFAKVAMTWHNYLICFLCYQLIASIFLHSKKSQYAVMIFSFLLIADGYASKGGLPITIRMFENWRFQTAMYMGGSIVRVCAFPLLFYFSYLVYTKSKWNIILLAIIAMVLLSFQTTSISYVLLFIPIFILGFILMNVLPHYIRKLSDEYKKPVSIITVSVVLAVLLVLIVNVNFIVQNINVPASKNIFSNTDINVSYLKMIAKSYRPYYVNVFKLDSFACNAFIALFAVLLLAKDYRAKIISIMLLFTFLIFKLGKSDLFLSLVSVDFYCIARMLTGIILMVVIMFGIMIVQLLGYIPYRKLIIPVVSLALVLGNVGFIKLHMKDIKKYLSQGDGMVKQGYSLKTLTTNNKMIPEIFAALSDYFDTVPDGKYAVFTESAVNWKGVSYSSQGILLASKKIMYSTYGNIYGTSQVDETMSTMNWANYVLNELITGINPTDKYHTYKSVAPYLKKANLCYILLTRKNMKKLFVKNGWKVVAGSDQQEFWLIKAPF